MAKWQVELTQTAVEDLREAATYMQDQLANPSAAMDFLDLVDEKISLLKTQPEACARVGDFELARKGYRWCTVGNFLMFFIVNGGDRLVHVERVLYGGRDWRALL